MGRHWDGMDGDDITAMRCSNAGLRLIRTAASKALSHENGLYSHSKERERGSSPNVPQ